MVFPPTVQDTTSLAQLCRGGKDGDPPSFQWDNSGDALGFEVGQRPANQVDSRGKFGEMVERAGLSFATVGN
jgi:hypothetical protein